MKHEVYVGKAMLAWGGARLRFSTLRITTHFIKSLMSGRTSSLHISILIRSSTLKRQSGCWQRKRLLTRREAGQHRSNSYAVGVTGARYILKASIGHDAGGFNALARQTGRRGRRCHRGDGKSSASGVGKYLAPQVVLITGDRITQQKRPAHVRYGSNPS